MAGISDRKRLAKVRRLLIIVEDRETIWYDRQGI
jgi:hypothetical protein